MKKPREWNVRATSTPSTSRRPCTCYSTEQQQAGFDMLSEIAENRPTPEETAHKVRTEYVEEYREIIGLSYRRATSERRRLRAAARHQRPTFNAHFPARSNPRGERSPRRRSGGSAELVPPDSTDKFCGKITKYACNRCLSWSSMHNR